MTKRLVAVVAALALAATGFAAGVEARERPLRVGEFKLAPETMEVLRQRWFDRLEAAHGHNTWAPMRMELSNEDLALMGLPNREVLLKQRYSKPTTFDRGGKAETAASSPGLVTFAGAGFFGIRPGAWLLLLNDGVGWCSMAHVFGSPGSYRVSTAGHCGKTGDIATVIGVVGNNTPVLIDFGKFGTSVDGGLGKDYAFIDVFPQYQHLVTPTMAFWGGPRGVYTKQGDLATPTYRRGWPDGVAVTPDPFLAQTVVHYGHGTAIGAGGTPRAGEAISWRANHFMFFGALMPGDSGSGSNVLTGDTVGANMEAAGINTHIWVDPLMRQGLGIMGGTRTSAIGTPANGQYVPYPVPAPGLP